MLKLFSKITSQIRKHTVAFNGALWPEFPKTIPKTMRHFCLLNNHKPEILPKS